MKCSIKTTESRNEWKNKKQEQRLRAKIREQIQ
jgi:hypothetical protein